MIVSINDIEIQFPTSLSELTLGQRIDFHLAYGQELEQMLRDIVKMPEGFDKELQLSYFKIEQACRAFAFFSGYPLSAIAEAPFFEEISMIYDTCLRSFIEWPTEVELQEKYTWNGQDWFLSSPELKHGDKMRFGEFIDAKQLVQQMVEMGMGRWEYMLPICAIYLRRENEAYQESFLYENSERLTLMRDLPMDIASHVGFFLSVTQNISISTLTSFGNRGQRAQAGSHGNILKSMVGSIS